MQDIFLFAQQHALLSIALIVLLLLLIIVEFIRAKQGAQRISPALATQMINHQNAVLLDVRSKENFSTGHIVDAVSIPLAELESKYRKLDKFKTRPIIIVCATGLESRQAAAVLTKNGFNIHLLAGGIRGWKEANLPLVKE